MHAQIGRFVCYVVVLFCVGLQASCDSSPPPISVKASVNQFGWTGNRIHLNISGQITANEDYVIDEFHVSATNRKHPSRSKQITVEVPGGKLSAGQTVGFSLSNRNALFVTYRLAVESYEDGKKKTHYWARFNPPPKNKRGQFGR